MLHRAPTDEDIDEICRRTDAHPRTVMRRLLGLPVRGKVGERVDRAIAEMGLGRGAQ